MQEALRAGRVRRLLIENVGQTRSRLAALVEFAREADVPVHFLTESALEARAGSERHQGAVAEVKPFAYCDVDDMLALPVGEDLLLLALDGVEDPQNLGAILRSADAAGVHGIILPERRAAGITAVVARASAGAVDHLMVTQVVNLSRTLADLKERGLWVYGLDTEGTDAYDAADYRRPMVLVSGAEGAGLSRLVREHCDLLIGIPMHGHVGSLNVSVATSLVLFAARGDRERGKLASSTTVPPEM